MADHRLQAEIGVIGGSLGGVAAAISAAAQGRRVILTCSEAWLGGQITSQGVSALDEHPLIEQFGGTGRYMQLREGIRRHYQRQYPHAAPQTNPGNGWVSRLCFDPRVGVQVLEEMLAPYAKRITILRGVQPISAQVIDGWITQVTLADEQGDRYNLSAGIFLDASDQGDLLPLVGANYRTGAEARYDTREALAGVQPMPHEIQAFTCVFAVEFCPWEHHYIERPAKYEFFRHMQPYSFTLDGRAEPFRMFEGELPFWTYRRIHDGQHYGGNDVAIINWHGNDYFGDHLLDKLPEQRQAVIEDAKLLSLGFLHWLQTEAPRDDGGWGYPELRLRPDVMGTHDGFAQAPYVRESRRILPLTRITAHDITSERATFFPSSVGVGWYHMDLHACVGNRHAHLYAETRPFQIPLGALVPQGIHNLLAACKNIGTTHLSSGAYRVHPVEWNIGESAGIVAAFCIAQNCMPMIVWQGGGRLRELQRLLLQEGIPLCWTPDIPPEHPDFVTQQQHQMEALRHAE